MRVSSACTEVAIEAVGKSEWAQNVFRRMVLATWKMDLQGPLSHDKHSKI